MRTRPPRRWAQAPSGSCPTAFRRALSSEKNQDYYGTPASLDRVTFRIFDSTEAELMALDAGSIDLCAHLQYDQISTLTNGYNVLEGTMNLAVALYLNNAVEPFDNELVRQALCYAIDVDEVMAFATGGQGVKIGSSMFPSFTKYFDASLADNYSYDVERAKELLAQAGYADGFSFTITYATEYEHPYGDMAAVIQQQLAEVGITVELNPIEWASWYTDTYQGRNFDATLVGFDTSVLTAGGMLQRSSSGGLQQHDQLQQRRVRRDLCRRPGQPGRRRADPAVQALPGDPERDRGQRLYSGFGRVCGHEPGAGWLCVLSPVYPGYVHGALCGSVR